MRREGNVETIGLVTRSRFMTGSDLLINGGGTAI